MLERLWIVKKEDVEKQGVFWNMMSSGLNSVVSMLLLWVVTRVSGVLSAGVFSLGFSTAQMMLTIGNYGMRNYQVTDVKNKYTMSSYVASRIITNIIMMGAVVVFCVTEGYYLEKAVVTILLCLLKMTDAFEDIYGGYYQKNGRLDISGKMMTLRIAIYVVVFCVCLIITNNLIFSCLVMFSVSMVLFVMFVFSTRKIFELPKPMFDGKKEIKLLMECFPLCLSAFLLMYMGNAPKYAIDVYLTEEAQAYYTYLFMPCFVTNLFVGFALQPLLVKMSKTWFHKDYCGFMKICGFIFGGAVAIAVFIVAAGGILGCPILSIVFGVELTEYRKTLVVLLVGGAFFSFAVIEQIILTVMRRQTWLLLGFGIASVVAFVISKPLVKMHELLGAGLSYTFSAGILFIVLAIMILFFLYIEKKESA